jgi:hypothetical protein
VNVEQGGTIPGTRRIASRSLQNTLKKFAKRDCCCILLCEVVLMYPMGDLVHVFKKYIKDIIIIL